MASFLPSSSSRAFFSGWTQRLKRGFAIADRWAEPLIIIGLTCAALLIFTLNLGTVPLRDWDEGLVAQVAKEIAQAPLSASVWLHPTLHGEPYFNKPPLVHWLVAIAFHLGGVNEWTARLPGAWATALSVPLLYGLSRELLRQRGVAVLATCTYLTMLPVVRHGRLAMLDGMVLLGFLLLLLCVLRSRRVPQWSVGVGLALSMVCLTKGIIGIPLMAIAVGFLLWDSPRLLRSLPWWAGVALGLLPAVGWYVAQGLHYGLPFWDAQLLDQMLSRAVTAVEQNSGPPWYYLLELLKYGWPWILFLPSGLRAAYRDRSLSWGKLALVWTGGYGLLISVMGTKLPWYIMPLYPVIALMVGVELHRLWQTLEGQSARVSPSRSYRLALAGGLALVALAGWGGSAVLLWQARYGGAGTPMNAIALSLATLGLTMTVAVAALWRRDRLFISVLLWGFYLSLLSFAASPQWVWELGEDYPVTPVAAMIQSANLPDSSRLFTSHPHHRPSLNFYADRPVQPTSQDILKQRWRNAKTVLLIRPHERDALQLKRVQVLAQSDDWLLIRRKPKATTTAQQDAQP